MKIIFVIWFLLKRILDQWRFEIFLFLGLLAAMAVTTAIPLYTSGALKESFRKDMLLSHVDKPPFTYTAGISLNNWDMSNKPDKDEFIKCAGYLTKYPVPSVMHIPAVTSGWSSKLYDLMEFPGATNGSGIGLIAPKPQTAEVCTFSGIDSLIEYQEGKAPSEGPLPDGSVEMACSAGAADRLGLIIGNTYSMKCSVFYSKTQKSPANNKEPEIELKFRLSGTFNFLTNSDNSQNRLISPDFSYTVFVNPGAYLKYIIGERGAFSPGFDMTWVMDYRKIGVQDLHGLIKTFHSLEREFVKFDKAIQVSDSPIEVFEKFSKKQKALQLMMLILALPTLFLVIYYVILTAGIIVDRRSGEIAMLRSRGAGPLQLTGMFIIEWSVLGIGCMIIGPRAGLILAQTAGASAGFLNFVGRKALPVVMTGEAYLFGAVLTLIMICAATFPAYKACQTNIVRYKQGRVGRSTKPIWQRFYIDFLLLGFGAYGYRLLYLQSNTADLAEDAGNYIADPLLFLIPVIITIACGLVVIRILPYITGFFEKIISRGRGISLYSSLIEISRNISDFSPLILLIIITTASGIYNAALARTFEQNVHDRIYYNAGADVILTEQWFRRVRDQDGQMVLDKEHWFEPPYFVHKRLPGVEASARVQYNEGLTINCRNNNSLFTVNEMAIEPFEFGNTAWFRKKLTPLHQNIYLNLLTKYPRAVLVSKSLLKKGAMKIGDSIVLNFNKSKINLTIAGAVDYWPALNDTERPFIIANLDYITRQSSVSFYQVWLRMNENAKISPVWDELAGNGIEVVKIYDTRNELIKLKKDPQKMGMFGIMSIGFCIACLITVIGYVLYTFIGLKRRTLQFGVLRAMGLSFGQLVRTLCFEQVWTAGLGLILGTFIGRAVSLLFVPFLRTAAAMRGNIPPFVVIISGSDIMLIYGIMLPVLLTAFSGLALSLSGLQMHQAVKLGEDS